MLKNLLLTKQKQEKIPAWFMRQAGRYLPEYIAVKNDLEKQGKGFFDMCDNPQIAAEITLQPMRRFDIDAAIIFSDILVIPRILGWKVEMLPKQGPVLELFQSLDDVKKLSLNQDLLDKTPNAIKIVKSINSLDLIGFAGAPFTVAMYMLMGGKIDGNKDAKKMIYQQGLLEILMPILIETTKVYLELQIEAGADVIKIFESHCGLLVGNSEYMQKYHIEPVKEIVDHLKNKYPQTPIILFPRGAAEYYESIVNNINIDGIALDESVDFVGMELIKKTGKVIQGNLDNYLLCYGSEKQIFEAVHKILNLVGDYPFIFNLGHGVLQYTDTAKIELVLKILRSLS